MSLNRLMSVCHTSMKDSAKDCPDTTDRLHLPCPCTQLRPFSIWFLDSPVDDLHQQQLPISLYAVRLLQARCECSQVVGTRLEENNKGNQQDDSDDHVCPVGQSQFLSLHVITARESRSSGQECE